MNWNSNYYWPQYWPKSTGGCPTCGRCPSCGRPNTYYAGPFWQINTNEMRPDGGVDVGESQQEYFGLGKLGQ